VTDEASDSSSDSLKKDEPKTQKLSQEAGQQPGINNDLLYKKRDLRIKHRQLRVQFASLILQLASLIVAGLGFYFVVLSLNNNTRSLDATVENNTLNRVADVSKIVLADPWMHPYFYEDKALDPKDRRYQKLLVATEAVADVLDIVSTQSTRYPKQWNQPEAWDKWTCDMLAHSPILRKYLTEHSDWYDQKSPKGIIQKLKHVEDNTKCE
jgi:hypothetical protein